MDFHFNNSHLFKVWIDFLVEEKSSKKSLLQHNETCRLTNMFCITLKKSMLFPPEAQQKWKNICTWFNLTFTWELDPRLTALPDLRLNRYSTGPLGWLGFDIMATRYHCMDKGENTECFQWLCNPLQTAGSCCCSKQTHP